MNDRNVMKLVKEDDALSSDMSPIVLKKYPEFYVLSYKQQNLRSDDLGMCYFVDPPVQDEEKFKLV